MPTNPNKTRCSVPDCRAWAIRGSDPPLCAPHTRGRTGAPRGNQNRRTHGFYAAALTREELADMVDDAADATLDAEIAIARVALRRLMALLVTGQTPGPEPRHLDQVDYIGIAGLVFRGAGTIARLLRIRHAITPAEPSKMTQAINIVLDQMSAEWGIPL